MRHMLSFAVIALSLAGGGAAQQAKAADAEFKPKEYHALFSEADAQKPHVRARSFDLYHWPFLDGQWEGIVADAEGNVWFGVSTHSGTDHGQIFRYDRKADRVQHVADLGQACGETLKDSPPQDKIHGQMFEDGDVLYAGTCEGHAIPNKPYEGGYWLRVDKKTGVVTNLGLTITKDGLLCVAYDPWHKLLYGNTNRTGELVSFDPATRQEKVLGIPWQDYIDAWKADSGKDKLKEIWPRGLTLMITPDGKVYGCKPPGCTFWCYDPASGKIQNIEVDMPLPADVAAKDPKALTRWQQAALHLTLWNEKDQCFYVMRGHDEMLCRFYPPRDGKKARLEAVQPMGLTNHRYGSRYASCTLVMLGRTVYYTPYTGWGGTTNLQSYNLETKVFTDYGPIVVEGKRQVNECHSLAAGKDGRLYAVAFVFSVEGTKDPVNPWGLRADYPFHPRFVIIDPAKDCVTPKP